MPYITGKLFKAFILPVLAIAGVLSVHAQAPAPYPAGTNVNYIRTWDALVPEDNANTLMTRDVKDVRQITQYLDGLGRPLQTVVKKGSLVTNSANPVSAANAIDLVSPVVYDEFGRESFKYLPFGANNNGGNTSISDGMFKLNPFQQQAFFYSDTHANSPIKGQGETTYYSQVKFEASPLNRAEENFAPGNNWAGTSAQTIEANRRSVKTKYWINTAVDVVRVWTVTNSALGTFGTYASTSTYPAGELFKNVTVDEHNKQVIEFKDKEGKVILKKVQLTAVSDDGSGKDHTGWLCTYYIYDDLNNLRCVIQPQAVKLMNDAANWDLTPWLAEQCFRYEYDKRQRMVMKKVPGATEVYLVYDARDRLVMTQDALLRAGNKWMVTLYDELNRPIQTGLLLNSYNAPAAQKTFVQHLASAAASTAYPFAVNTPPTTVYWEYLTKTGYDNYSAIPAASGLTDAIDNSYNSSNYGINTSYNVSPDYAQQLPATASSLTKGLVTWTETKVLGTSTYLYTVNLYDDKRRLVQVKSKNITGGADLLTTQYSWSGQPLANIFKQVKSGANTQTTVTVTKMTYDDLGRLVQTDKKIQNSNVNGNALPASYTTISKHEYDALGQLKKKMIGNKPGAAAGTPLANLEYDYNIRGWLLSINKEYITATSNNDRYFGMQLGYDKNGIQGTFAPQYNGNIGGTIWKSEGDQQTRKYDFTYDAVNRLTKAGFTQYVDGSGATATFNINAGVDFSMGGDPNTGGTMKYDANGNIIEMWQTGLKSGSSSVIDKLTYSYNTNSNKLLSVFDNVTPTADNGKLGDFKDGSNGTGDDYTYDDNGNLIADNNKAISSITYNHLNLPLVVTVTGKGTIAYVYDAAGNKQQKTTTETGATVMYNGTNYTGITITTTTTYLGGTVYESKVYTNNATLNTALGYTDKLQFIGHEEGRIRGLYDNSASPNTLTGLACDYMLKDHLGNIRSLLTEEQKTQYYPAATLEGTTSPQANSMINYEKQFYNIDNTKVVAETDIASWPTESVANSKLYYNNNGNPPSNLSYPSGCTPVQTDGSHKLYRLNATSNRTGLEFVMKVMAGDKIDIFGKSYFLNTGTVNNSNSTVLDLASVMASLLGAPANAIGTKGVLASDLTNWNTGLIPSSFFRGTNGETTTIPKAYINYIFLDEQFKYAGGNFSRVGSSGVVKDHWSDDAQLQDIKVPKNGYIFVYVSNESNLDVFFDNLQVIHKPGPILEETHYYPFGLTMAGISSMAVNFGTPENKYKFNKGAELQNKEFSDGSGLELYSTNFRCLDPQLGRWWQIDPKPNQAESPYASMANNPIANNDPLGDTIDFPGATAKFKDQFQEATTFLEAHNVGDLFHEASSKIDGTIHVVEISEGASYYDPETKTIHWDPTGGVSVDNAILSPATVLNHELDHAVDHNKNPKAHEERADRNSPNGKDAQYGTKEEKRVIEGTEQKTARALGEIPKGFVTRKNHGGYNYPTTGPTTTKSAVEESLIKDREFKKSINQKKDPKP
ncbi:DUF6443 domain-containing protein [Niastella populi]|uniref:DUF6443 domain-containing protein n=1 Tax=Niastella populi TaxID=550983 RepID=A0A1V9FBK6_9BACT|nr:DUF6443 domain-containing protein [Niastella populi]OQP55780.1 hypothetical protein A4R26_27150 [Niastella populi]